MHPRMMFLTASLAACAVAAGCASTPKSFAETRLDDLDRQIQSAARSGELTTDEASGLRAEHRMISDRLGEYRTGGVTSAEEAHIVELADVLDARLSVLVQNLDDSRYSSWQERMASIR